MATSSPAIRMATYDKVFIIAKDSTKLLTMGSSRYESESGGSAYLVWGRVPSERRTANPNLSTEVSPGNRIIRSSWQQQLPQFPPSGRRSFVSPIARCLVCTSGVASLFPALPPLLAPTQLASIGIVFFSASSRRLAVHWCSLTHYMSIQMNLHERRKVHQQARDMLIGEGISGWIAQAGQVARNALATGTALFCKKIQKSVVTDFPQNNISERAKIDYQRSVRPSVVHLNS